MCSLSGGLYFVPRVHNPKSVCVQLCTWRAARQNSNITSKIRYTLVALVLLPGSKHRGRRSFVPQGLIWTLVRSVTIPCRVCGVRAPLWGSDFSCQHCSFGWYNGYGALGQLVQDTASACTVADMEIQSIDRGRRPQRVQNAACMQCTCTLIRCNQLARCRA